MPIIFNSKDKTFHLSNNSTSYIFQIVEKGYLAHLYWGKKVRNIVPSLIYKNIERCSFSPNPIPENMNFSLDSLPQEYPTYGSCDFRHSAFDVSLNDGTNVTNFLYKSHNITKGKPQINGLPSTYSETDEEASTLEIILYDDFSNIEISLFYTIFENYDAITRWSIVKNKGTSSVTLTKVFSSSLNFHKCNFDFLHLNGYWARERHLKREPISSGLTSIESRRGASSHHHNPFIAILDKDTNEISGNCYGFSFVYSGNFIALCEVDQYNYTRVSMGINPHNFSWQLNPENEFSTPEVVMVYSSQGIGEMSRKYHDLYRQRLCKGIHRDRERPVLINNWEATYFDFTPKKIEDIANVASKAGVELFVLDDGWFGKRNSDTCSLGDWYLNKNKLPHGLEDIVNRVNKNKLKFGLWFEPEMVSPDSNLYREHPDWCLHVDGRQNSLGRNQLVLDLTRKEVRDKILNMMAEILDSVPIDYIKWDMNRNMTEVGSPSLSPIQQKETSHRYILGLYEMLEYLTNRYPNILFESCSGGGGRFDPGMLYYMPQTWTSDDTDAVERLKIQYGTSIVYPLITMGAHVSVTPNHQVGRTTPLETRGHVAMFGNLGYELDLTKSSPDELEMIASQIELYNQIKPLIQFGDFYRILSPFQGNETAWMCVSKDKTEAVVSHIQVLAVPNSPVSHIKLLGLNPDYDYKILETGEIIGGDMLMFAGINLPIPSQDFKSVLYTLRKV
jgi:alpha-galactosidase